MLFLKMNTLHENLELVKEVRSVAKNLRTSVKGISKHFSCLAKLTDEGIAKADAKSGKFEYIRISVTLRSIVLKRNGGRFSKTKGKVEIRFPALCISAHFS